MGRRPEGTPVARSWALGATMFSVFGLLALVGVAVGLAVAYTAAPYAQDLLFEVSPRDPRVLGSVCVVLLVVSVAASLIPGLRATRVDPVAALKTE